MQSDTIQTAIHLLPLAEIQPPITSELVFAFIAATEPRLKLPLRNNFLSFINNYLYFRINKLH